MGIFSSFGKSSKTGIVEQQSHTPLGLDPAPELSHTIEQLSKDESRPVQVIASDLAKSLHDSVAEFVSERPLNMFVIDGERDVDQSIICTKVGPSKTCLKLKANLVELFRTMQRMEYFCSLPDDVNATYFECRKIQ